VQHVTQPLKDGVDATWRDLCQFLANLMKNKCPTTTEKKEQERQQIPVNKKFKKFKMAWIPRGETSVNFWPT
jgi:hypothetical protein